MGAGEQAGGAAVGARPGCPDGGLTSRLRLRWTRASQICTVRGQRGGGQGLARAVEGTAIIPPFQRAASAPLRAGSGSIPVEGPMWRGKAIPKAQRRGQEGQSMADAMRSRTRGLRAKQPMSCSREVQHSRLGKPNSLDRSGMRGTTLGRTLDFEKKAKQPFWPLSNSDTFVPPWRLSQFCTSL